MKRRVNKHRPKRKHQDRSEENHRVHKYMDEIERKTEKYGVIQILWSEKVLEVEKEDN